MPPPTKDRNLVCDFANSSGRPVLFRRNSEPGGLSEHYSPIYRLTTVEEWWCYFQQDGARAHTACATMEFLREFFDDRLISWTARSPDLMPLNFFLWDK